MAERLQHYAQLALRVCCWTFRDKTNDSGQFCLLERFWLQLEFALVPGASHLAQLGNQGFRQVAAKSVVQPHGQSELAPTGHWYVISRYVDALESVSFLKIA